ncbi:hypothetical protein ymoll0001_4950 [Yersinia mollaretii ATCC 43969]|uniref:Uncharacterized protein n=1 Tax=Yersinia mollaretii (strain ATCC 43969 / DSM 18520 / CIP 103324 / CNY 7263 / WAIP 204) TaxID=349967 RepID=A0ABM9YDD1_YERMW|nr:hypothetical protein ymoll0001_4950 [Yersinia mollaretii ATCC 43969]
MTRRDSEFPADNKRQIIQINNHIDSYCDYHLHLINVFAYNRPPEKCGTARYPPHILCRVLLPFFTSKM